MKSVHLFTAVILVFVCSLSFGQSALNKGNYLLGGSVSFSWQKDNNDSFNDKYQAIQLSPQYSYFIIDNFSIGGLVSFDYYDYEWTSPETFKSIDRTVEIGPVIRYYFRAVNLIPFLSASATYEQYLASDNHGYTLDLSTGFDFFIAKSLALEPFIDYTTSNFYKPNSDSNTFSFGVRLNYFVIK
jgi:hypothetical protein